eukprot:2192463-Alexandrium_andersonii.AAC.1
MDGPSASATASSATAWRRTPAARRAAQRWARCSAERLIAKLRISGLLTGAVACRLAAAAPAVSALAGGRAPTHLQRLRRNVALHAERDIDF